MILLPIKEYPFHLTEKLLKYYDYFCQDQKPDQWRKIYAYQGFSRYFALIDQYAYPARTNNIFYEEADMQIADSDKIHIPENNKVCVGFSCGLDSIYQALKYKEKGFDVHLFHVAGINRQYPDETQGVKEFAEYFNMPLEIVKIGNEGREHFCENPMKDQIIMAMMIDYGIHAKIAEFTLGNKVKDKIQETPPYGLSDSIDACNAFDFGVRTYIANYRTTYINASKVAEYQFIAQYNFNAYKFMRSCFSPTRFKRSLNARNVAKYGIMPLSGNRCMSCYKCCLEWIVLTEIGRVPYDEKYLRHCYDVLRLTAGRIQNPPIAAKGMSNEQIKENIFQM